MFMLDVCKYGGLPVDGAIFIKLCRTVSARGGLRRS